MVHVKEELQVVIDELKVTQTRLQLCDEELVPAKRMHVVHKELHTENTTGERGSSARKKSYGKII